MRWFLCVLCFGISSVWANLLEITYTTYSINGIDSSRLYVATSQGNFFYAGWAGKDRFMCTLNKNNEILYPAFQDLPAEGLLECGDVLQANFKDGNLVNVRYQNNEVSLQKINEFFVFQGNIQYQLRKGIAITLRPICSVNTSVQAILNRLYDIEFTCETMNKQFQVIARESLGDDFEKGEIYQITLMDAIIYFDEHILVIDEYNHLYSGGAHGMSGQVSRIFKKNGDLIELNDLLDLARFSELKEILWGKLQQISRELFIGKSEFKPSENISISYEGISFIYAPYELLPYSYGSPRLSVDFKNAQQFFIKGSDIDYLFK